MPQLAGWLGTALDFLDTIGESLVVDAARMKANLEAHGEASAAPGAAALEELLGVLAPHLS